MFFKIISKYHFGQNRIFIVMNLQTQNLADLHEGNNCQSCNAVFPLFISDA